MEFLGNGCRKEYNIFSTCMSGLHIIFMLRTFVCCMSNFNVFLQLSSLSIIILRGLGSSL